MGESLQTRLIRLQFISSGTLKLIAAVSMVIDHIGFALYPHMTWLRIIGRISFPIYCFMLAEGVRYTKNIRRFLLGLALFALLSEIPFNLAFWKEISHTSHQNVFFTLFLGAAVIALWEHRLSGIFRLLDGLGWEEVRKILILACACLIAAVLHTDYGWTGVMLIVVFYHFRDQVVLKFVLAALLLGSIGYIEPYAVFSFIPIALYDGRQTLRGKTAKRAFYALYPVHLSLLWLCWLFMHHKL